MTLTVVIRTEVNTLQEADDLYVELCDEVKSHPGLLIHGTTTNHEEPVET